MKKNVLALSIAAMIGGLGLAGVASAEVIVGTGTGGMTTSDATELRISDAGVGHNLLVPYFNAQNGNMSVFHVVNTDTVNGKAVKVRFRSASNSDDILDFQVFLSPGDVWTAAVTAGANGVAQITTADNSCTVPALQKNVARSFVTDRLNPTILPEDKANQTREGYVELFNMADIPPTTSGTETAPDLYYAIKHKSGVAPCSVAGSASRTLLNSRAITNHFDEAATRALGFDTPTSGLLGDWYIINVPQTTTFSGAATSVVALDDAGVSARGNFVHFPQTAAPFVSNTATRTVDFFTADPLFRTDAQVANGTSYAPGSGAATLRASNYDLPDMSTPYATQNFANTAPLAQANLLTSALAATSVTNQYATDAVISAKTDWVFSMPTRRYSVVANYAASGTAPNGQSVVGINAPNYRLFSVLAGGTDTAEWFRPNNTSIDSRGNICVAADATGSFFRDREEGPDQAGEEPVFSPGTPSAPTRFSFCGETSVLSFADAGSSVLAGNVARQNLTSGIAENGWGLISTVNGGPGLPILGSAFIKLTNPDVGNGVSGNFGITWPHRFTRALAPAAVTPTP
ncbi:MULTISPECIES: cell surface protein [unclassified Acidovorax]|uniref:cell surface protein n=1 Tax=unclassified Acidovorax TaxID=2684926 RepID=UPI00288325D7|nr:MULTISPECIES: cell surface protein [unclassified Acidovorax]